MKTLLTAIVLSGFFLVASPVKAAPSKEIRQVVTAEQVEELATDVALLYMYKNERMNIAYSTKAFDKALAELGKKILDFKTITTPETEGLVEFMEFTYDELKDTLHKPYSKESVGYIIDYSESLVEAAEGIQELALPKIEVDKELEMLLRANEMKNLLDRANRYYIGYHIGLRDVNSMNQMMQTLSKFNKDLKLVNNYPYKGKQAEALATVDRMWKSSQRFYRNIEKSNLPRVVLSTTTFLLQNIQKLSDYHARKSGIGGLTKVAAL
jgi:hypothetical protein